MFTRYPGVSSFDFAEEKLDTITNSVRRLPAVMHHHATKMTAKPGQLHECAQSNKGQCVQRLNKLATDVGQSCCAKPRTVLNDVALSDAHS